MSQTPHVCPPLAAFSAVLVCLSVAPRAAAQADDATTSATSDAQPATSPPPSPAPDVTPTPRAPERAPASTSRGAVEWLPPSAYPAWQPPRGIPGGSLAGTMHGVPWPYYPKSGVGISGSVWVDFGYETIKHGLQDQGDLKFLVNQSRGVLRATPTYSDASWYVQAQAELVANGDQSQPQPLNATTDDLWVRTGEWKRWDVQLGRFEAFEVYHFGMGMDLNTLERKGAYDGQKAAVDVPGLGAFVYRQNGAGNLAAHLYPTDYLRFELLGQLGNDASSGLDGFGGRPAGILDLGWLKLKVSGEWRKQFHTNSKQSKLLKLQRGGSAALQLVFAPYVELGGNAAFGLVDNWSDQNAANPGSDLGAYDAAGSTTDLAFGGFLNARVVEDLVAGVGFNRVRETDQVSGVYVHTQGFVALQYLVNRQLALKLVGGYAKYDLNNGKAGVDPWSNTMNSVRLRAAYTF
jgi:hypothetical protein